MQFSHHTRTDITLAAASSPTHADLTAAVRAWPGFGDGPVSDNITWLKWASAQSSGEFSDDSNHKISPGGTVYIYVL